MTFWWYQGRHTPACSTPCGELLFDAGTGCIALALPRIDLGDNDITFADPAIQKRLADIGQDIPSREQQTPEALGVHHKAEIEKWWPIIKAAGIKAE